MTRTINRPRPAKGSGVVGLDLSLTATGIALASGNLRTLKSKALRGPERLIWISNEIMQLLDNPQLVVIENYAFGSKYQGPQLGELGGQVKVKLFEANIPYLLIPPTRLKMYATGNGNASKEQVLIQGVDKFTIKPANNNEADAGWLRLLGLHALGRPEITRNQKQLRALEKLEWSDD